MRRAWRIGTGHDSALWPVLLLLLVVLVPTVGLVWLLRAAMENERLAVRQRLADVYQEQLAFAKRRIEVDLRRKLDQVDAIAGQTSPAEAFARIVTSGAADSVLILEPSGQLAYPATSADSTAVEAIADPDWLEAQRLEFADNDTASAVRVYRALIDKTDDPQLAARGRQALARCLVRLGDHQQAIVTLHELRQQTGKHDAGGRSLAADAELRLLELVDESSSERPEVAASLVERLNRYDVSMSSEQRRFLMREAARVMPETAFPTLAGEVLAAEVLAAGQFQTKVPPGQIRSAPISDVWLVRSPRRIMALYRTESMRRILNTVIAEQPTPEDVTIAAHEPAPAADSEEFVSLSLGPALPGWRLALSLDSDYALDATASERTAFFVWTAIVVVVLTAALALLVAGALRRQMQLARLKNDLVATVSHELKTPLASIRLLVDTLLDTASTDAVQGHTREYLGLIAAENARLSHLIDNFLTFSRMERGKHRFDCQPADAALVVRQAVEVVAERYAAAQARLRIKLDSPLPVRGDANALVTVMVNLLDNALKYTGETKEVVINAKRIGDRVSITVADNGIGLSPRAARRVFDRFFQVDQHLSRGQGGCGLGLSIVRFIVEAHGGRVEVESRLGEGSKFIVTLPLDVSATAPLTVSQPIGANR